MSKRTMKQHIMQYVKYNGSITPAKMIGKVWEGKMFGSSTSRRCRGLRKDGLLDSKREGKFTKYYMNDIQEALMI